MEAQPNQQELIPTWKVLVDGSPLLQEAVPDVLSVEVRQHADGPDSFDLAVSVWDVQRQELQWLDDGTFAAGRRVEVRMGYGEELESVIDGEICAQEIEYGAEEAPVLRVEGYDKLHRFRRGRRTRTFANVKDSEVAERIARDLQLQADVEDSELVHAHLFQYNQSDVDFLQERARRIHFEVDVVGGTLVFRRAAHAAGRALTLSYHEDLRSFTLRLSTLSQVQKVVVKGWDVAAKEAIVGLGQAGDERSRMGGSELGVALAAGAFGDSEEVILDRVVFAQSEADQIAKAVFDRMSLAFLQGEGETIGNAALRAGEVVELGNLGQRMSGLYYLTRVEHLIDEDGFRTRFACRRNATS